MRKTIDGLITELQALSVSKGNLYVSVRAEVKKLSGEYVAVQAEAHSLQVEAEEGGGDVLVISSNDGAES